jgi:hypothetical protein
LANTGFSTGAIDARLIHHHDKDHPADSSRTTQPARGGNSARNFFAGKFWSRRDSGRCLRAHRWSR